MLSHSLDVVLSCYRTVLLSHCPGFVCCILHNLPQHQRDKLPCNFAPWRIHHGQQIWGMWLMRNYSEPIYLEIPHKTDQNRLVFCHSDLCIWWLKCVCVICPHSLDTPRLSYVFGGKYGQSCSGCLFNDFKNVFIIYFFQRKITQENRKLFFWRHKVT